MALTQTIDSFATPTTRPQSGTQVQLDNVIAFPASRVHMQVSLPHPVHGLAGTPTPLRSLLHSPLGVYVVSMQADRDAVRVLLDISTDDLDFTLHTLISTLPAALIGPVKRRGAAVKGD